MSNLRDAALVVEPAAAIDTGARAEALERQSQLTKPAGSLGRFEDVAVALAGMQGTPRPRVAKVHVAVFAADHGVAARRVSAYPREVTGQMVAKMAAGGAAVSVLSAETRAELEIIDVGTLEAADGVAGVRVMRCGAGTADFTTAAAMTESQLGMALAAGRRAANRAQSAGADLFIGGEMGIGNTTCAAALACALLGEPGRTLAGPGTGLDEAGIARKIEVIDRALALHRQHADDPLEILRRLGGFEIAALAGAYTACARNGVPVLVDGYVAGVAALVSTRLCRGAGDWFLYAHRSAEPGHGRVLEALGGTPLLDLGFRLGEGSGALAALPLIHLACTLHAQMASFEEARVAPAHD